MIEIEVKIKREYLNSYDEIITALTYKGMIVEYQNPTGIVTGQIHKMILDDIIQMEAVENVKILS